MATSSWTTLGARLCTPQHLCSPRPLAHSFFSIRPPHNLSLPLPIFATRRSHCLPSPASCSDASSGGAVAAAIAVAGISILLVAHLALASEVDGSPIAASAEQIVSFAVPDHHQEISVLSQNGFSVPLPRNPSDGLVTPFPRAGKGAIVGNNPCPRWAPSEFEMVMPDFNGRPKPFPRKDHRWAATFVVKGLHRAFLQASFLEAGLAFAESEASAGVANAKESDQENGEGKTSVPKSAAPKRVPSVKQFTCYSL